MDQHTSCERKCSSISTTAVGSKPPLCINGGGHNSPSSSSSSSSEGKEKEKVKEKGEEEEEKEEDNMAKISTTKSFFDDVFSVGTKNGVKSLVPKASLFLTLLTALSLVVVVVVVVTSQSFHPKPGEQELRRQLTQIDPESGNGDPQVILDKLSSNFAVSWHIIPEQVSEEIFASPMDVQNVKVAGNGAGDWMGVFSRCCVGEGEREVEAYRYEYGQEASWVFVGNVPNPGIGASNATSPSIAYGNITSGDNTTEAVYMVVWEDEKHCSATHARCLVSITINATGSITEWNDYQFINRDLDSPTVKGESRDPEVVSVDIGEAGGFFFVSWSQVSYDVKCAEPIYNVSDVIEATSSWEAILVMNSSNPETTEPLPYMSPLAILPSTSVRAIEVLVVLEYLEITKVNYLLTSSDQRFLEGNPEEAGGPETLGPSQFWTEATNLTTLDGDPIHRLFLNLPSQFVFDKAYNYIALQVFGASKILIASGTAAFASQGPFNSSDGILVLGAETGDVALEDYFGDSEIPLDANSFYIRLYDEPCVQVNHVEYSRKTSKDGAWEDPRMLTNNLAGNPFIGSRAAKVVFFGDQEEEEEEEGKHGIAVMEVIGARFLTSSDIAVSRTSDGGKTWTDPQLVDASVLDLGLDITLGGEGRRIDEKLPDIAFDPSSNTAVIVWSSTLDPTRSVPVELDALSMFYAISADNGASWTNPMPLVPETGDVDKVKAFPSVIFEEGAGWHLIWGELESPQVETEGEVWHLFSMLGTFSETASVDEQLSLAWTNPGSLGIRTPVRPADPIYETSSFLNSDSFMHDPFPSRSFAVATTPHLGEGPVRSRISGFQASSEAQASNQFTPFSLGSRPMLNQLDAADWSKEPIFSQNRTRKPSLATNGDIWVSVFTEEGEDTYDVGRGILCATSPDGLTWSDPVVIVNNEFGIAIHENPSLMHANGKFVLAWNLRLYSETGALEPSKILSSAVSSSFSLDICLAAGESLPTMVVSGVPPPHVATRNLRPQVAFDSESSEESVLVAWEQHTEDCLGPAIWGNALVNHLSVQPLWLSQQGVAVQLHLTEKPYARRIGQLELHVATSEDINQFTEMQIRGFSSTEVLLDGAGQWPPFPDFNQVFRTADGTLRYETINGDTTQSGASIYKAILVLANPISIGDGVSVFEDKIHILITLPNPPSENLEIVLADKEHEQGGYQAVNGNILKYFDGSVEPNFSFIGLGELDIPGMEHANNQTNVAILLRDCHSSVALKINTGSLSSWPSDAGSNSPSTAALGFHGIQGVHLAYGGSQGQWMLAFSALVSKAKQSTSVHLVHSSTGGASWTYMNSFGDASATVPTTFRNLDPCIEYDAEYGIWVLVWTSDLNEGFNDIVRHKFPVVSGYLDSFVPDDFNITVFSTYMVHSEDFGISWSVPQQVPSSDYAKFHTDIKPRILLPKSGREMLLVWRSLYVLAGDILDFEAVPSAILQSVGSWNSVDLKYEFTPATAIAASWGRFRSETSPDGFSAENFDFKKLSGIAVAQREKRLNALVTWDSFRDDALQGSFSMYALSDPPEVFSPAPKINTAVFANDGTAIEVAFDKETNRAGISSSIFSCSAISLRLADEADSVSHQCSWLSNSKLSILLSSDASVTPFDTLFINEGSNITIPNGLSFETIGSKTIDGPNESPVPQVTIQGSQQVSKCGTLRLETSISGTGGRELIDVKWTVTPSDGEVHQNVTDLLTEASVQQSATLEIPGRMLTSGTNYTFDVEVENWLNGRAGSSTPKVVSVVEEARADVRILGSSLINMRADQELDVTADIELNDDCVEGDIDELEISYSVEWSFDPEVDLSGSGIRGAQSRRLRVGPALLAPGSYTLGVSISATIASPEVVISGESSVEVVVTAADMVAVIRGGSLVSVSDNEDFELDASRSCDPNQIAQCRPGLGLTTSEISDGLVTFDWTCEHGSSENRNPCADELEGLDTNNSKLSIPQGNLSAAASPYFFKVNISPVGESGESTLSPEIQVDVLETIPECIRPRVGIESLPSRISGVSSGLTLRGLVRDRQGAALKWQANGEAATSFASKTTRENLEILPGRLSPGTSYKFRLTAELPCTNGADAFAEVAFDVNAPPRSGQVSVTPSTGVVGLDVFEIKATAFEDPENDLPLEYSFEMILDTSSNRARSLSDFRRSSVIRTRLPLSQDGESPLTIIAVARDSLGAESGRSVTTTVSTTRTVDLGFFDRFADVLQQQRNRGSSEEDILRTSVSLGSSVSLDFSEIEDADPETLRSARNTIIESVSSSREAFLEAGGRSPRILAMQISALLAALTGSRELNDEDLRNSTTVVRDLLRDAIQEIDLRTNGEGDPFASSILPNDFGQSTLGSIESVMSALQQFMSSSERRRMRRRLTTHDTELDPCTDDACEAVDNTRASLRELTQTILRGSVPGSSPRDLPGVDIQLVTAKEVPSNLGDEDNGLSTLVIPQDSRRPHDTEYKFWIPSQVLDQTDASDESSVDVVAVLFWFNVRELVQEGLVNASEVGAPLSEVQEIMTLEFQSSFNSSIGFHPSGLDPNTPIRVWLPLDASTRDFEDPDKEFELGCGSWVESESTWKRDGCEVVNSGENFVVCECSHASDYSTWQAFLGDASDTFTSPISAVTTIALLVLGILIPAVLAMWVTLALWAHRRDRDDAEMVHKGAFLLLVKNRIHLRRQQRLFYVRLKGGEGDYEPPAPFEERITCWKRSRRNLQLLLQDNSLFSIFTRFDPNYTRVQRVTVFTAVIVANLFASSIAFELRTADDVSLGFLVGSIVAIALVVTFPVKIIVRKLFKMNSAAEGSAMDRVAEIYRIGALRNNILPTAGSPARKADRDMMFAFKRYFVQKHCLRMLRLAKSEQEKKQKEAKLAESKGVGACCYKMSREASGLLSAFSGVMQDIVRCRISFKRWRRQRRMRLAKEALGMKRNLGKHGLVASIVGQDGDGQVTDAHIEEAKLRVAEKRVELLDLSKKAKAEWGRLPEKPQQQRLQEKKLMVQRQRSALLKVAVALSAEPESRGTSRACCAHRVVYFSWALVWIIFGLCFFYTAQWLSVRTQRDKDRLQDVEDQSEAQKIANDEDSFILVWISSALIGAFSGLLLAEPFLHFVRFYALPCCVKACGSRGDSSGSSAPTSDSVGMNREEPNFQRTQSAMEGAAKGDVESGVVTAHADVMHSAATAKDNNRSKTKKWGDYLSDAADQLAW